MQIKTITLKQTIQLKPYQPLVVEVTADIYPDDNPNECVFELRRKVEEWVNLKLEKNATEISYEEVPWK